jgi:hypothetical protein
LKRTDNLGEISIDGRIILKKILDMMCEGMDLIQLVPVMGPCAN